MSTIKQIPVKKPTYSFGNKSYTEEELVKAFPDAYQQYQMAYGGKIPQHGFGQWLGKNAGAIGAVAGGIGGFFLGGPAGASAGAKLAVWLVIKYRNVKLKKMLKNYKLNNQE